MRTSPATAISRSQALDGHLGRQTLQVLVAFKRIFQVSLLCAVIIPSGFCAFFELGLGSANQPLAIPQDSRPHE